MLGHNTWVTTIAHFAGNPWLSAGWACVTPCHIIGSSVDQLLFRMAVAPLFSRYYRADYPFRFVIIDRLLIARNLNVTRHG